MRNVLLALPIALVAAAAAPASAGTSFADIIGHVQPKIVKIHGAGGFRGLEAYQSGFLISANGHVLTAWSYVLDSEYVTVTLDDGRKFQATLVGQDPLLEIAVLKVDAEDTTFFELDAAAEVELGARVLAFSNLFGVATGDEPASVLHGIVAAKTDLAARHGAYQTRYQGPVYVVDAMTNNPGAAGGALTDRLGNLVGLLGKELRSATNNNWLNYAIPIVQVSGSVADILQGTVSPRNTDNGMPLATDPVTLDALGIVVVPDVLHKTPPFIDRIVIDSPAHQTGLQPDDLVMFVGGQMIQSCRMLADELSFIERADEVRIVVLRDQDLLEVVLYVD